MAVEKQNGDIILFVKQKDYIMVNNNLGGGSFGKTVLLKDPFNCLLRKNMNQNVKQLENNFIRIFSMKSKFYTNSITKT